MASSVSRADSAVGLRRAFARALADSTWQVRLHAADLAGPSCASDAAVVAILDQWIALVPADASQRAPRRRGVAGGGARDRRRWPASIRRTRGGGCPLGGAPSMADAGVRRSGGRRALGHRASANARARRERQREGASDRRAQRVDASQATTRSVLAVVTSPTAGAQAVRAAARALLGSAEPGAHAAENAAFARWVARDNASARGRARRAARSRRPSGERRSAADDAAWTCRLARWRWHWAPRPACA